MWKWKRGEFNTKKGICKSAMKKLKKLGVLVEKEVKWLLNSHRNGWLLKGGY